VYDIIGTILQQSRNLAKGFTRINKTEACFNGNIQAMNRKPIALARPGSGCDYFRLVPRGLQGFGQALQMDFDAADAGVEPVAD